MLGSRLDMGRRIVTGSFTKSFATFDMSRRACRVDALPDPL